jgi:hypothetical protein
MPGKIDAFFWVGGLPTAAVSDLANSPGNKIKMIDHAELVAAMNKKYGNLYVEDSIPKATYRGMDPTTSRPRCRTSWWPPTAWTTRRPTTSSRPSSTEGRHRRGAQGSRELQAGEPEDGSQPRCRGTPARSSTSPKRASSSIDAGATDHPAERAQLSEADIDAARCRRPRNTSSRKRARPTSFKAGWRPSSRWPRWPCRRSTCTRPTPSCRRRRCGRCTWPSCCSCASWCSRWRRAGATA